MKPLNLPNALKLYDVIAQYLPEDVNIDGIDFIKQIIDGIISKEKHKDFIDIIMLSTEISREDILELSSQELLELFAECLSINKILLLKDFCMRIGYHA
jgi:hypothetical protein